MRAWQTPRSKTGMGEPGRGNGCSPTAPRRKTDQPPGPAGPGRKSCAINISYPRARPARPRPSRPRDQPLRGLKAGVPPPNGSDTTRGVTDRTKDDPHQIDVHALPPG